MADTNTNKRESKDNVLYLRTKVLIEGIEVPFGNASVSYGINGLPSCSLTLPGASSLRELPPDTKVLVLYKNPDEGEDDPWYVLFDGEFASTSYTIDSNGAYMTVSCMHCTSEMERMQLICQEACSKLSSMTNLAWSGGQEVALFNGVSSADVNLFKGIFGDKKDGIESPSFKSMADIFYCIINAILNPVFTSATTKYYYDKIIAPKTPGYKLTSRIAEVGKNNNSFDTVKSNVGSLLKKSLVTAPYVEPTNENTAPDNTIEAKQKGSAYMYETGLKANNIQAKGGSNGASLKMLTNTSLNGTQHIADKYKEVFANEIDDNKSKFEKEPWYNDLYVTAANDQDAVHAKSNSGTGHYDGYKIDFYSPYMDPSNKNYDAEKTLEVVEDCAKNGIKMFWENDHWDCVVGKYSGNTKFSGFKK